MRVAIVLVHYHTADLAVEAYETLSRDLRRSGISGEWVMVDNGSRPPERERLRSLPVRVIDPGANLGYAGGANLGVRETDAEHVLLMNPDVMVLPGCAQALCSALAEGAAVAGPRFYWDRRRRWLLPPTEVRTRRDELLRVLGERSGSWAGLGRRRWRRHARRCWTASEPYSCYELSGALLAFRRQAWVASGGFDEGYRLYFEETDWLERLRRQRLEARFVPRAEAVHLYAQSTIGESRAEGWFADSHRRFRRRFHGAAFTRLLELLGRVRRPTPAGENGKAGTARTGRPAWIEVSTSPIGYPAAGLKLGELEAGREAVLEELRESLPAATCYVRTLDMVGRELTLDTLTAAASSDRSDRSDRSDKSESGKL